jgi:hypothetical protein
MCCGVVRYCSMPVGRSVGRVFAGSGVFYYKRDCGAFWPHTRCCCDICSFSAEAWATLSFAVQKTMTVWLLFVRQPRRHMKCLA